MDEIIESEHELIADDRNMYRIVKDNKGVEALQKHLDKFHKKDYQNYPRYHIDRVPLQELREMRDLGIIVDNRLNFNSHINSVVMKAKKKPEVHHQNEK